MTNLNQGQEEQTKCAQKFAFSPEEQEVLSALEKQVKDIKGAKYALSHRPENCTQTQTERLKLIENSYPDLYRAYQLKESLRLILHMKDYELAALELDSWIAEVSESGLRALQKLAEKILRHRDNILNAIRFQANSAKSESTNTTIKVLIKMARGFRNMDNMIALIYLKCSDLTIPLNNRPQPTKQYLAAKRKRASDLRLAKEQSGQKYATQT